MIDLATIQEKIISFRNERDWAQFHYPKNLVEALFIEARELLANFDWKTTEQSSNFSPKELRNIQEEQSYHSILRIPLQFRHPFRCT